MKSISIAIVALVAITLGVVMYNPGQELEKQPFGNTEPIKSRSSASATSTYTYFTTATASSSLSTPIGNADSVSFNICATASSSSAYLDFWVYLGNGTSTTDATATWFNETDALTSSGLITHTPLKRTISLATSTTYTGNYLCTNHLISPVDHKLVKVVYGLRGANAGVYTELVPVFNY